ncbi:MAG: carbohydrate ABC transporter permease [Spirochaetaceae bacterium]|nr:MAG: carbohydrate ABC transporter permease [Spirochaetaceae bacterium]
MAVDTLTSNDEVTIRKLPKVGARLNRISVPLNIGFSLLFMLIAAICVVPVVFVLIISLSSNASIQIMGYRFIPTEWTLSAYRYLYVLRELVGRAFLVSVGVTVVGTVIGLYLNSTMGYVLSRRSYRFRRHMTWLIFIPMLFNGGLVATYLINTRLLSLGNTYWALILPLAVTSFYVIILRTFFQQTIPDSVIESAKIDGASQHLIFYRIILPISLPALATIGLFLSFAYWNDWFSTLIYIQSTHQHMYPLQYVLVSIDRSLQFLTRSAQFLSGEDTSRLPAESARMAIVMVVVIPIALSYPFFQKYFVSGLTIGAVKG